MWKSKGHLAFFAASLVLWVGVSAQTAAPAFLKAFTPESITAGETSRVILVINNNASGVAASNLEVV